MPRVSTRSADIDIRTRVLRALALNRTPGYHFAGNFLDLRFDVLDVEASDLSLDDGAHCRDAKGEIHLGALALLADMAMAGTIRSALHSAQRLATVSMSLTFTGAPRVGRMVARGRSHGFLDGATGRLGLTSVEVSCGERVVAYGTGSFLALDPPKGVTLAPVPMRGSDAPEPTPLAESALHADERAILATADAALAAITPNLSFIELLWSGTHKPTVVGASGVLKNGLHVGNRVHHVQGGLQVGFAAAAASVALPAHWALTGVTASYISPGEGKALRARSKIVHKGRLTAVVRTQLTGKDRRVVLEVVSQHASCTV